MKKQIFLILLLFLGLPGTEEGLAQAPEELVIFQNQPINFGGNKGDSVLIQRYQKGRLILKRVKAPIYREGTDVKVKMSLRSAGDAWDKSGSVFVIPDPDGVDLEDIAKGEGQYPEASGPEEYPGVKKAENYEPALEVLRFMTPFGVGYYSNDKDFPQLRRRRPVYIPQWEEEVFWELDVSQLAEELTGEFLIGVWIDTWTPEGYEIDLSLEYSGRPLKNPEVMPLVNTIYYAEQRHPDLFAYQDLALEFELQEDVKNAKLYYITTGHGGHRGGDEFIKVNNRVSLDGEMQLDTIPWRNDCASFRRFNPHSGVWTRKETLKLPNKQGKLENFTRIEEMAASDISRSNWCPGSLVEPYVMDLRDLEKGEHFLNISIDAAPMEDNKMNHWLVSAYLVYEAE